MSDRTAGMWLVLGAAVLWGTTGTTQALAPAGASPLAVGAVRLVLGGIGLVAVGGRRLRRVGALPSGAVAITSVGIAAYQVAFFGGVARAGVALGTVVAIGSSPILAGALSWAVRGDRPSPSWGIATILAVAGVALIAGTSGDADAVGILMALAAGLAYAVYAVGSKHLIEQVGSVPAMAAGFFGGALLLSPLLLFTELGWLREPAGVVAALWLGVATVTVSYLLFGNGLRRIDVATTATLSLAEPATATLLGVLVLSERPEPIQWAGVLAIGLALTGMLVESRRRTDAVTGG